MRLGGADRYATSAAVNRWAFRRAPVVYVATGAGYADALAGAALAGTRRAPLVIARPTCFPLEGSEALVSLEASRIRLLGGLGALGPTVERLIVCETGRPTALSAERPGAEAVLREPVFVDDLG